jgi:hypothetical protein
MIAFVGAALWITKGDKLISKTVNKYIESPKLQSVPENNSANRF